jgi:hypothetical protein
MNRPCLDCGTPTPNTRCPTHTRARDRQRGTTTQRGYGTDHQKLRAMLLPHAIGQPCPRCGQPMLEGQALDLGHIDTDRTRYSGIEHANCNRNTATRRQP